MKKIFLSGASGAIALLLAACGTGDAPHNEAVAANDADRAANMQMLEEETAEPSGQAAAPTVEAPAQEAQAAPRPSTGSRVRQAPEPAPRTVPAPAEPAQPADPHAGHDMNNMSH